MIRPTTDQGKDATRGDGRVGRRAALGLLLGAAGVGVAGCGTTGTRVEQARPERARLGHTPTPSGSRGARSSTNVKVPYGSDPAQHAELHLPGGDRRRGTVVLIHGGFWRAEYTAALGTPLAVDLAKRGWVAWNLEYRSVGSGGGWPTTFADVAAGLDQLAEVARRGEHGRIDTSAVVAVGHSAGGQLAAWLAGRGKTSVKTPRALDTPTARTGSRVDLTGVVSQAGVLDLAVAARTGVGGSAVADLLGGTSEQVPARYHAADPIQRLPIGVPVHCVHSKDDTNVPYAQSTAYVDAATKAGDQAVLHSVEGDHLTLIDPSSVAWGVVVGLLPQLLRR